jgi:phosphoglycolate phosphatase
MNALYDLLGRQPQALLFDLDGTLIDSAPDLILAVNAMLSELNLPSAEPITVRSWIGNGARKLVERALLNASLSINSQQLDEALEIFFRHYRHHLCDATHLYEGVMDALNVWQKAGIKMACVTNKPMRFTESLLTHFQLDQFMPVVIGGDSLPVRKPHPAPLLKACELLGVNASDAIMVGDSSNDVEAARAAGMKVACVSYGYNHGANIRDTRPDCLVDSFVQLL